MGVLVRIIVNAATIAIAAAVIPGIELRGIGAALIAGLALGVVNAIVPGFAIRGFGAAFLGALVVSAVSWVLTAFVSDSGRLRRL